MALQAGNSKRNHTKKGRRRLPHAKRDDDKDHEEEGTGVNKIKSAIRQTKRILARDSTSASARQEAERKLVALEDELESRQSSVRERKNAVRYHKVRFFERQKLTRRIEKIKKQLEKDNGNASQANLEDELKEQRILLNYVLHFPMAQKYVALFPNNGPSPLSKEGNEKTHDESSSSYRAQHVQKDIVLAMEKGELSNEPEIELSQRKASDAGTASKPVKRSQGRPHLTREEPKSKRRKTSTEEPETLESDDFFA